VIQSVLDWHFMKDSAGTTRTISVEFTAPPQGQQAAPAPVRAAVVPRMVEAFPRNLGPRTLSEIQVTGLSDQAKSDLLAQLPVHVGDSVSPDQFVPIMEAVHKFDSHLTVIFPSNPNITSSEMVLRISAPGPQGGVIGGVPGGIRGGVVSGAVLGGIIGSVPKTADAASAPNPQRIMVGGNAQAEKLVLQSLPVYPPLAKQAHISGTVELSAVIGKDGHVMNLSVVRGHPLLVQSALDAVKDWVYQPTLLNGQPVEVSTTIDVNFTLAQ